LAKWPAEFGKFSMENCESVILILTKNAASTVAQNLLGNIWD